MMDNKAGQASQRHPGHSRWRRPWLHSATHPRGMLGTLLLVGFLLSALSPTLVRAEDTVTLNLKNADMEALIATVSEITGKNFVVDPRVKGKVTVISSRPMDKREIYQVFLSILNVHGFAAVPSGEVVKILPDANAKQDSIPTTTDRHPGNGEELVTRVVRIENVSAAQLVPILRPLVPQQGHLAAYPDTNMLIISDRAANIERLVEIIRRIDIASDDDIEVIQLRHASAPEVALVLSNIEAQPDKGPGTVTTKLVADERTNSIIMTGDKSRRLRLRALITHLDTPLEAGGNTQVIYLRYAKAKDLVPVLQGVSGSITVDEKGAPKNVPGSDVSIQADETTNALVITAPPGIMVALQNVIRQLDIRRAQVLVEAVIAEVSFDRTRQLGVQWVFDGTPDGQGPVGVINFGDIPDLATAIDQGTTPTIGLGTTIGIGQFDSDSLNFAAVIRALAGDSTTNILSTPRLLTLDNEEAEIVVGQNVPFVTGTQQTTGGLANPFQTIQRQDVGLTLKVKPQINEGNAIKLDVEQEVSTISPTSQGASDIVTNKRSIKTSVLVDDGNVVVLGGLIQEDLKQTKDKVPGLGDVPVLGWLFNSRNSSQVKTNLMVFLHPKILRDPETATKLTGGKYNYIRNEQLKIRAKGVELMGKDSSPLLPTLKEFMELPPPFEAIPKSENE